MKWEDLALLHKLNLKSLIITIKINFKEFIEIETAFQLIKFTKAIQRTTKIQIMEAIITIIIQSCTTIQELTDN